MNVLIETLIYLIALIGIVVIIGSFFEIFTNNYFTCFQKKTCRVFDFKKDKTKDNKIVKVDVYLNNFTDEEIDKVTKKINDNDSLKEISDFINIYINKD